MLDDRGEGIMEIKLGRWVKPLATTRALYLLMFPSLNNFSLYIHFEDTARRLGGKGIRIQVSFLAMDSISSAMAACQKVPLWESDAS
jgi:hypothetical protein